MEAYLDNSATTRPTPAVLAAMQQVLTEDFGNPSSLHRKGLIAEQKLREARRQLAQSLHALPEEIIFTSGGTEANNLALLGSVARLKHRQKYLVTSKIEHASVLNVFKYLETQGYEVSYLNVDANGIIDLSELQTCLERKPALVSTMWVNNEVGSIQPIAEIAQLLTKLDPKPVFHTDAIQAFGKLPLKLNQLKIDLLTVSAHKIHGPKGCGALFVRKGIQLQPLLFGGGQEAGLRAGTENIAGIVGFGAAIPSATANLAEKTTELLNLKNQLRNGIREQIPAVSFNSGTSEQFAPHILNVSFQGVKAEVLLHALEQDGIYVSTGSACNSRKKNYSYVLKALGLPEADLEGAIRFSFSTENTTTELNYCLDRLKHHVTTIRQIMR